MKRITIGILAHVDAGKTTLSEAMLYQAGTIRRLGRVDNKDAFLDTDELERARGITIFSKQAVFDLEDIRVTLLDTPGHVDFSPEMERTLQVLDYAVLVISGADGIQGHTQTLWHLLEKYGIPVFLFINKMDQDGTSGEQILEELKTRCSDSCVDFTNDSGEQFYEASAMCEERALEEFLETGKLGTETIQSLIGRRYVFPCFFGSALKMQGVAEFMTGLGTYMQILRYPEAFGAKVFKIARDEQGTRLTYLKVTGGSLKVKAALGDGAEKVNQIRIYSGEKYETSNEAEAGCICAVTGLTKTRPGEGFGIEEQSRMPLLEPVLTYQLQLPDGCDAAVMLPKLRQLEEEEPQLHIVWKEELQEIQVQIMGEVQTEILKHLIAERFGMQVIFGTGNIVYKETILDAVEGVGHFEPLRHYAEVHLLLEPLEPGSGLVFDSLCSEDMLDRNWQRLVLTHLEEREHKGVLTGAAITDMKITLVAGRAHQKHTEGGDFRQATYRAVRQGLKQARSVLLEPYYTFRLEVPESSIGRAMTDIEKMHGTFEVPQTEQGMAVFQGSAPVSEMREYQKEVIAYTRGQGRLFCAFQGYQPCHNTQEIMEKAGYDPERDLEHPTGSVFCAHGAGFVVSWDKVWDYMHVESPIQWEDSGEEAGGKEHTVPRHPEEDWIGTEEIDAILARTFDANKREKSSRRKWSYSKKSSETVSAVTRSYQPLKSKEEYLLVDGYNIIFAWRDLKELAEVNMDGAKGKLLDILSNYQGIRDCELIVVFDAYRVKGHGEEMTDYHNIHVVYTKEAETADQYIEKFAHENGRKYQVTVATSDGLEQIIIRGQDCRLLSARELKEEVERMNQQAVEMYQEKQKSEKLHLLDGIEVNIEE